MWSIGHIAAWTPLHPVSANEQWERTRVQAASQDLHSPPRTPQAPSSQTHAGKRRVSRPTPGSQEPPRCSKAEGRKPSHSPPQGAEQGLSSLPKSPRLVQDSGSQGWKCKRSQAGAFWGRRAELPAPPPAAAPQPARVPHTAAEPKAWLCFLWSLSQVLLECKQVQLIALLWFFSEARIWPLKC